jgi:hypothetical protein
METKDTNITTNQLPAKWSVRDAVDQRRRLESGMTILDAMKGAPSVRSPILTSSSEDILHSGAIPGASAEKAAYLKKTKAKRLNAHLTATSKTIEETKGWRVRAAYRLVTYMARITGILQGPTPLMSILLGEFSKDPCNIPFEPPDGQIVSGTSYIIESMARLSDVEYVYSIGESTHYPGMTLLPPPIPDHAWCTASSRVIPHLRRTMSEPRDYEPEDDHALAIWLDCYDYLASSLWISQGTIEEPGSGIYGTAGMFNANSCRMLWPTQDELITYENLIMLYVYDLICEKSIQYVEGEVMKKLGYGRDEALMLVKTALRYGNALYEDDMDTGKVRELKALDIIMDAAKDSQDVRAALSARKSFQQLAGMTKESGDLAEDFRLMASKALADDDEMGLLE